MNVVTKYEGIWSKMTIHGCITLQKSVLKLLSISEWGGRGYPPPSGAEGAGENFELFKSYIFIFPLENKSAVTTSYAILKNENAEHFIQDPKKRLRQDIVVLYQCNYCYPTKRFLVEIKSLLLLSFFLGGGGGPPPPRSVGSVGSVGRSGCPQICCTKRSLHPADETRTVWAEDWRL